MVLDLLFRLASEVVSQRVRTRALLELLEEKGILAPGEFEERGQRVWERDWPEIAAEVAPELLGPEEDRDAR
ncbi:MAG: hypothetical protein RMM58_13815 [Chloroflexota bacterium]|nr:hypothetical protein [Dehalococcoidia bacterium]MDW8254948.1 hypothetical protein [Chloroflexota bacterium]